MMLSVALASALWAGHDFVLPHLGVNHNDVAALAAAAQTQLAGFHDWKVRTTLFFFSSMGHPHIIRRCFAAVSTGGGGGGVDGRGDHGLDRVR